MSARFLLEDHTPERTQEILNGAGWIRVLRDLVAAGNPITHEVLDALPQDNRIGHLRTILVYTGTLEAQADGIESSSPWLKSFLAGLSPTHRSAAAALRFLVRRYRAPDAAAARSRDHRERPPVRPSTNRNGRALLDLAAGQRPHPCRRHPTRRRHLDRAREQVPVAEYEIF